MKQFTVVVHFANGDTDFFRSTKLEEARKVFERWKADIQSVYVRIF